MYPGVVHSFDLFLTKFKVQNLVSGLVSPVFLYSLPNITLFISNFLKNIYSKWCQGKACITYLSLAKAIYETIFDELDVGAEVYNPCVTTPVTDCTWPVRQELVKFQKRLGSVYSK